MLVPFEWLGRFIELKRTPAEAAHALTMAGLEVESVEGEGDRCVLNINVTPNRPDCLSIYGIARELSAITGEILKPRAAGHNGVAGRADAAELDDTPAEDFFKVEILDPELCHRYTGRIIRGVKVGESPPWMRRRLEACGIRAINNVVDVTNYVLLETGHPLHAFDLKSLRGNRIRIFPAAGGEVFHSLDGIKRSLPAGTLMIWDGAGPVAVAGVIGGMESGVTDDTVDIFLESAYFDPSSIRRTSRVLNIRTESSYRFERGADVEGARSALDRAASLYMEVCGGVLAGLIDVYPKRYTPVTVSVNPERVRRLLGVNVSTEEIDDILNRLHFVVLEGGLGKAGSGADGALKNRGRTGECPPGWFLVMPPSYRKDIENGADIVEEVARLYGYERIPPAMPSVALTVKRPNVRRRKISLIKESMRMAGFTETINYSFMPEEVFKLLEIGPRDQRRRALKLKNPIQKEHALMRTFFAPSLVSNLLHNINRGMRDVDLYETGKVFIDTGETLPQERFIIGAVSYREERPELWREMSPAFYSMKGILEGALDTLGAVCTFKPSDEPFLNPGQSADVYLAVRPEDQGVRGGSGEIGSLDGLKSEFKIGYVGMLSPSVVERLDVRAGKPAVALLEISLDAILEAGQTEVRYRPAARFPSIERDLALVVDEPATSSEIIRLIRQYPDRLIESVEVFDSYKGKNIPEGKKSLAFHIVYRDPDKTLTDVEIDALHALVVGHVTQKTGAGLRV
jgi:phenylalanyl-tRNA synthetase beta chain